MSRQGTFCRFRRAVFTKQSNVHSVIPGTTAALNFPGSARARGTNSASVLIFMDSGTPTPRMVLEIRASGTRSAGVYGSFSYWNGCTVNDPLGDAISV